jgi:hypothetical protein
MTFDVHTPSGCQRYTGNARYDVEHPGGGLLTVWTHDGDKIVYGPAGWYNVTEARADRYDGRPTDHAGIDAKIERLDSTTHPAQGLSNDD